MRWCDKGEAKIRRSLQTLFDNESFVIDGDRNEVRTLPLMNSDPYSAFLLGVSTCRPLSRGFIEIGLRDPFAPRKIHPNYLTAPEDMIEQLDGVRFMRRLAGTSAMRSIIEAEMKLGPAVQSEEELIEDIRQRCGTVFHLVGTCIMGPDSSRAVVDSRLRVDGFAGLRVIDASVFPNVTSGNTNAPAIMVAEKGADIVLEDFGGSR